MAGISHRQRYDDESQIGSISGAPTTAGTGSAVTADMSTDVASSDTDGPSSRRVTTPRRGSTTGSTATSAFSPESVAMTASPESIFSCPGTSYSESPGGTGRPRSNTDITVPERINPQIAQNMAAIQQQVQQGHYNPDNEEEEIAADIGDWANDLDFGGNGDDDDGQGPAGTAT